MGHSSQTSLRERRVAPPALLDPGRIAACGDSSLRSSEDTSLGNFNRWSPKPGGATRRSRNDVWEEWLTYSSVSTPIPSARNTALTDSPLSSSHLPSPPSSNENSLSASLAR